MSSIPLAGYLTVSLILFCIGFIGVLVKRNTVIVLISIELMLNAVNINFVAFAKYGINPNINGQIFALFIIAVAAAEAAVGIAILLALYRKKHTVDIESFKLLKR